MLEEIISRQYREFSSVLRQEVSESYSKGREDRFLRDYLMMKNDFYRLELHKVNEVSKFKIDSLFKLHI